MCLYPIRIRNPGYESLSDCQHRSLFAQVSDGPIPEDYELDVPCGKCYQCLRAKRFETILRLKLEQAVIPYGSRSYFVTLTFDNPNLDKFKDAFIVPLKRWLDLLRKRYGKFRYWFLSELGDKNGRFHFHGILFGLPNISYHDLCRTWRYGISWFGWVTDRTCGYITKYMIKQQFSKDYTYKPIKLFSKSLGLTSRCVEYARRHLGYFKPSSIKYGYDCISLPGATRSYAIPRILFIKLIGEYNYLRRRLYRCMDRIRYVYRGVRYRFREDWYNQIVSSRSQYSADCRVKSSNVDLLPKISFTSLVRFDYLINKSLNCYGSEFGEYIPSSG